MNSLEGALMYARQGWRVHPLRPRSKRPVFDDWPRKATTDAGLIKAWFDEHPDANVGIVPDGSLQVVDLDTYKPETAARLAQLEQRYGPLPDTLTVATPQGGHHRYYRVPDDLHPLSGDLGPGIELRGGGGRYVVAPPSIHPDTGTAYRWASEQTTIATAPEWLWSAIAERPTGTAVELGEIPGLADLPPNLMLDGALARLLDRRGPHDDLSAGDYSLACRALRLGATNEQAAALIAEHRHRHGGKQKTNGYAPRTIGNARAAIDAKPEPTPRPPAKDRDHTWTPIDLLGTDEAGQQPPSILGLFYAGKRHLLFGEGETGKSWILLAACLEQARLGRPSIYVDLEMGREMTLERLRLLGATDADVSHVVYLNPQEPLTGHPLEDIAALVQEREPAIVGIDAFDPFLVINGLEPNSSSDVELAWQRMDAFRSHGAALIVLDHVTKDPERRDMPIGSQRKLTASDVAIRIKTYGQPFGEGIQTQAGLQAIRDRPAKHRRGSDKRIGRVDLDARGPRIVVAVQLTTTYGDVAAVKAVFRPTRLMQRVSELLEATAGGRSKNSIEHDVTAKSEWVRTAIEVLVREGYASEETGERRAKVIRSVRPYRETDDPESDAYTGPKPVTSDLVPLRPDEVDTAPLSENDQSTNSEGSGVAEASPGRTQTRMDTGDAVSHEHFVPLRPDLVPDEVTTSSLPPKGGTSVEPSSCHRCGRLIDHPYTSRLGRTFGAEACATSDDCPFAEEAA